ncbi:unnamed protein product [Periconia digitata]|uniref:Uncharacterized protein n=1 Tax=Periconia digitata TaxID=1303443 RepID=A0A9W4U3R5_9PLEO|nr:unnamed protein product [Periconia digitata]
MAGRCHQNLPPHQTNSRFLWRNLPFFFFLDSISMFAFGFFLLPTPSSLATRGELPNSETTPRHPYIYPSARVRRDALPTHRSPLINSGVECIKWVSGWMKAMVTQGRPRGKMGVVRAVTLLGSLTAFMRADSQPLLVRDSWAYHVTSVGKF